MIPLLAALGILVVLSAAGLLRRAWRRRRLRTLEIDVTRAIGRAERAETRDDARDAWGEVATLEAELAQAYPAATLDGGIAREGLTDFGNGNPAFWRPGAPGFTL